jgi:predicted DsbA family dithiol-disulfide isomerase
VRLDELVARRGDDIAISWRSFLLRTEPKFPSREGFAAYTESWARPAAMEPAVTFRTWDGASDEPPSSSLPAQISAKAVDRVSPEATSAHHHALMEAYFTANRDISNWEVLADVASHCGVDMAEYAELLGSERQHLASLVIDDHNAAVEREIYAVPSVLVADRLVVPGAQDVEVYERIIDRMKPSAHTA